MSLVSQLERLIEPQSKLAPSFRLHLQGELLRRCRNRPGYSLRAFAKALSISPSSLSRILKGERAVSQEMLEKLGRRLGLSPDMLDAFSKNLPADAAFRMKDESQLLSYAQLSQDIFTLIADWYHYALLELVRLDAFDSDPKWIAQTLGITISEVNAARERLVRLGLLNIDVAGRWSCRTQDHSNVTEDLRAAAYRKLQRQILEQALRALDETPVEQRDQSSMTMAIRSERLPEAVARITLFRREMSAFLEAGDSGKDRVYQLSISLFPITSALSVDTQTRSTL